MKSLQILQCIVIAFVSLFMTSHGRNEGESCLDCKRVPSLATEKSEASLAPSRE